jgi:hypothetical protein
MTTVEATARVFWLAFKALPKKERAAVVEKLLHDKDFAKNLMDSAMIERRRKEPSISLEAYLADRKKK